MSFYAIKKIMIWCISAIMLFAWSAGQASDASNEATRETMGLQKAINDLKNAIQIGAFAKLKFDMPEKTPLSRGSCTSDTGLNLSFDEMINSLSRASMNVKITLNEKPVQLLYLTTFETHGWKGENPYLYFAFKKAGDSWRWLSVYECSSRSSDFRYEQGEKLSDNQSQTLQGKKVGDQSTAQLISKLKNIIPNKDFQMLRPYVPRMKKYYWGPCGPGDSGFDELSFEVMTRMLLRDSKGAKIYFNPKPNISQESALIETEGWIGEHPFLTFSFDLVKTDNRWALSGACYSATPELSTKKEGKYVPTYFREPQLPRPGPKIFKDRSALRARIEEIVQFKAFDALKTYAVKQVLTFGQCNLSMMENDRIEGKEMPVQDVINFLKQNIPSTGEIVSSGMQHKNYYETTGWSGEYPFVAFWFSEGSKGWEFAGVSYCKTRHFDLFPPLSPLK